MSSREERIARNEAAARDINEEIEDAKQSAPDQYIRILCECGYPACERVMAITPAEYTRLRGDPGRFAVVREHVIEDVERVVSENDRYVAVTKREGTPADIAVEEDPRN